MVFLKQSQKYKHCDWCLPSSEMKAGDLTVINKGTQTSEAVTE